jgi:hypothetical protein
MTKPYTVVCVPDPTSERPTDIEENTYVAHVIAENISKAMAAGQIEAAENNGYESIDWAVVFMCEGHVRNINDEPDVGEVTLQDIFL